MEEKRNLKNITEEELEEIEPVLVKFAKFNH